MLHFIITILPLMAIIAAIFTAASRVKPKGTRMMELLYDFGLGVVNSPAQVAFFMFSFTAAMAASLTASKLAHISNQLVITLDIIFLLSSLLLILYHRLKEHASTSM